MAKDRADDPLYQKATTSSSRRAQGLVDNPTPGPDLETRRPGRPASKLSTTNCVSPAPGASLGGTSVTERGRQMVTYIIPELLYSICSLRGERPDLLLGPPR